MHIVNLRNIRSVAIKVQGLSICAILSFLTIRETLFIVRTFDLEELFPLVVIILTQMNSNLGFGESPRLSEG